MSDEELGDAMCAAAAEEQEQPVTAGAEAATAAEIPAEAGLFMVKLAQQADGAYGGTLKYATDEAGDFQMATGPGTISVFDAAGMAPIEIEKTLALSCAALGLAQGNIVELAKDSQSVIELSGFQAAETPLLIGPAGGHHHHDAGDPHFWLDPTKAIEYVENIRDGLSQADPAGKDVYAENAEAYIAKLQELDTWIARAGAIHSCRAPADRHQPRKLRLFRRPLRLHDHRHGRAQRQHRLVAVGAAIGAAGRSDQSHRRAGDLPRDRR